MKTSPIAVTVWVLNLGLLAGGAFFVIKTHKEFKAQRLEVRNIDPGKKKNPETWEDQKQRGDTKLNFRNIYLTPGAPGVVIPDRVPGNGGGTGEVKPPPPPPVNFEPILKGLKDQADKMFKVQHPMMSSSIGFSAQIDFELDKTATSMNFFRDANVRVFLGEGSRYPSAALSVFPFETCVVSEVSPQSVVLAVETPALKAELAKAKRAEGGDKVVRDLIEAGKLAGPDGPALIELGGGSSGEAMFADDFWASDPSGLPGAKAPTPAPGAKPTTTTDAAKELDPGMPNVRDLKPAEKPPEKPAELTESKQINENEWDLGSDVLTQKTFDDLANFATPFIDAHGKPAGLQVSESLPEDASNVAYKMGARRGDVIKKINGEPVRNTSEVQAVVRRLRNAGTERFVVEGERNGVPMTKVFNVKAKKQE